MANTPNQIIVHHSGGTDANPLQDSSGYTVDQCNTDHKIRFNFKSSLGWYVGYQYFIDKAGVVTQCREDNEEGAHTKETDNSISVNKQSIGICLAGNFDATLPTEAQKQALKGLMARLTIKYNIGADRIFPHRHYAQKSCYGNKLPDTWAKDLFTPVSEEKKAKALKVLTDALAEAKHILEN